ncbi:unnamed protein product [Auanema sp. JU1783]|nr:unnamed protein product [Auanema sp. JU1783]
MKHEETSTITFIIYLIISPLVISPFISSLLTPNINEDTVYGYVKPSFQKVHDSFRRNFGEGLEREGAALSVYHRGKLVVNLWGGYADRESNRKWKANTRTVLFSATKAISALCVAVLVDRGYLSYDDKVTDYWPEYGRHGKGNTTIEHVLSHMAGLPYLDEQIEPDDIINFDKITKKLENSKPVWEPGTKTGYHPVTFGFLIDAIVRRADPRKRDLSSFFKEEIANKHDLAIDIGIEKHEAPYIARITTPGIWEYIRDSIRDPKIVVMLGIIYARLDEIVAKIRDNPSWIAINYDTVTLNDPEVLSLPMGAVTGVSGAESLARLFALSIDGQILSNRTLDLLMHPTINSWHKEEVTLWPVMKGRGFFYERNPLIPGAYTFGHPGFGGQFIHVDPRNELVISYVANGLKTGTGELCTPYMRLMREVYRTISSF